MPLEQLCSTWKKTTHLPKERIKKHLKDLEEANMSGVEIKERINVRAIEAFVRKTENGRHEIIQPVNDMVLQLLDDGKEVCLTTKISEQIYNQLEKPILEMVGVSPRILDLPVKEEYDIFNNTNKKKLYELSIKNEQEPAFATHVTNISPEEIVAHTAEIA